MGIEVRPKKGLDCGCLVEENIVGTNDDPRLYFVFFCVCFFCVYLKLWVCT